jgi:hypothetical protein
MRPKCFQSSCVRVIHPCRLRLAISRLFKSMNGVFGCCNVVSRKFLQSRSSSTALSPNSSETCTCQMVRLSLSRFPIAPQLHFLCVCPAHSSCISRVACLATAHVALVLLLYRSTAEDWTPKSLHSVGWSHRLLWLLLSNPPNTCFAV